MFVSQPEAHAIPAPICGQAGGAILVKDLHPLFDVVADVELGSVECLC